MNTIKKACVSFLALGWIAFPAFAQTNFIRVTNSDALNSISSGAGVGWADYDNDGYVDLFVANFDGNNYLFRNHGDSTFTAVTNGALVNEGSSESYGVAWGDYNNDGYPDLLVGNGYATGNSNFLYLNDGKGGFTKITDGPIVSAKGYFSGCAWADFDRDGFIDLFVANNPVSSASVGLSTSVLYHNNGDGTFTKTNSAVAATSEALVGAWADFDNDGWPDLFVANGFGDPTPNFLYRNLGNGHFARISSPKFSSANGGSVCAAWGDYDNDGFLDVFVANFGQKNELYHNNRDGTFTQIKTGAIATDISGGISAAWGDYDNDGWLDLYVGNRDSSDTTSATGFLYHNNGDGTFTKITAGPIAEYSNRNGGCGWGDYDNDGFLDLFVSSLEAAGPTGSALFHNTGNSNHWLKVKCTGVASNRMAIGAKVRAQAIINGKPIQQLREITTGDGFGNGALTAHFGLGDATNIDVVRIEWPSGATQEIHGLNPNQSIEVSEPPTIRGLGFGPDGVHLQVRTSRASTSHRVESSSNLRDWTEVTTIVSQILGEEVPVLDPATTASMQTRFYRVAWLDKGYTP